MRLIIRGDGGIDHTKITIFMKNKNVQHPQHYGGGDNPFEAIKVIEAWGLGFHLGNTLKYISRAGKKDPSKTIEDLEKALWYAKRFLEQGTNSALVKIKDDYRNVDAILDAWGIKTDDMTSADYHLSFAVINILNYAEIGYKQFVLICCERLENAIEMLKK